MTTERTPNHPNHLMATYPPLKDRKGEVKEGEGCGARPRIHARSSKPLPPPCGVLWFLSVAIDRKEQKSVTQDFSKTDGYHY